MLINQYQSRRHWNLLPSESKALVFWWRVTDGKRQEDLKQAPVFVEIFVEADGRTLAEQEKSFVASLKGYGAVVSKKESTIGKINKKI